MIGVNLKNSDFQLAFDQTTILNRLLLRNSFQTVFLNFNDIAYVRTDESMSNLFLYCYTDTYQVQLTNCEQLFELLGFLKQFKFIQVNSQTFVNIQECFYVGIKNNQEVLFLKTMGYIPFPDKFLIQNNIGFSAPNALKNSKHIKTRVIADQYPSPTELRKEVRLNRQASFV